MAGSRTHRSSATVPTASAAETATVTGDVYQPAAPFGVGGLSDTVAVGAVLSMRNVAFTGAPALPSASMLAAYSVCGPWVATDDPAPAYGQPAGSSANVVGGTAGSSAQRVSTTVPPGPSSADTATVTGDTYQPPPPLGAGGSIETAVVGGVRSVNAEQVNARGVTMSDQPLSVPVSNGSWSATRTVQSPLVPRPFSRDNCPTRVRRRPYRAAQRRGIERGPPAAAERGLA